MSKTDNLARPRAQLLRRTLMAALALLAGTALAQNLANLLPQETFAAVGVSGLAQHEGKFQPFIDEWQRLDVSALFAAAFPEEASDELDELEQALPPELKDLGFLDVAGGELWLAASASRSSPLPAVTVVGRVSAAATAALTRIVDEELADADVQTLREGSLEFRVMTDEDGMAVAFATDGDFVAASSNPDVLRGVLRRYQGAAEPNFTDSAGYAGTVAPLLPSNGVAYFDLPHIVDLVQPFGRGLGFDATFQRLGDALRTVGAYASVTRITAQGIETLSLQALGDQTLDPALYALLAANHPVSGTPLRFVDGNAIGYQASGVDVSGWWNYLDGLAAALPELGIGGLDAFVTNNLGLDLKAMLFDWMGTTFATISHYAPTAQIGAMPDNLLGSQVFLIQSTDLAAAESGLTALIQMGGMLASSFADPYGEGGATPEPVTRSVAGVDVDSYLLTDGVTLELAFTGDYVVIATSSDAMDGALTAAANGGGLQGELARLAQQVPSGAGSITVTDSAATFRMLAEQLDSQFGLLAGLTGSDIDFDAAERAGDAVAAYMQFVAGKLGGQYTYGVADGGVLRSYSFSSIDW